MARFVTRSDISNVMEVTEIFQYVELLSIQKVVLNSMSVLSNYYQNELYNDL